MHAVKFLHKLLRRCCPDVHLSHVKAIVDAVNALTHGRRLSITGVGRALESGPKTKHRIKRIDRLAGNPHLAAERVSLYQALAHLLVGNQPQPLLLVDWSDARVDRSLQLLRAGIVVEGRSLTLYEEVHPLRMFDNRVVRERFLARLRDVLPSGCRPILITDGGFRVSWFRQVEALGWDWISRVRGRSLYRMTSSTEWSPVCSLHVSARTQPSFVGEICLTQQGEHRCQLYSLRSRRKGRSDQTHYGERRRDNRSRKCAHRQTEPWLLATSLRGRSAGQICKLYGYRMQIEGTFRDLKNAQWGFHLRAHRTHSPARLAVLLLLGTLATFAAYVTGLAGVASGLHRDYQANTSKRRVLSYVYLGLELIRDAAPEISPERIRLALADLTTRIETAASA